MACMTYDCPNCGHLEFNNDSTCTCPKCGTDMNGVFDE